MRIINKAATCENIRNKLLKKGLTPAVIQKKLYLESVQAVYKWISPNNKTIPSIDNLIVLSQILECSLEDLIITTETETVD